MKLIYNNTTKRYEFEYKYKDIEGRIHKIKKESAKNEARYMFETKLMMYFKRKYNISVQDVLAQIKNYESLISELNKLSLVIKSNIVKEAIKQCIADYETKILNLQNQ